MSSTYNQDDQDVSLLALDQYMRLVKWTPELTLEEEGQLLERVERGRQEQRNLFPIVRYLKRPGKHVIAWWKGCKRW